MPDFLEMAVGAYGLFWVLMIIIIIKSILKKRGQQKDRPTPEKPQFTVLGQGKKAPPEKTRSAVKISSESKKNSLSFMEDRKHDWLAQQLREERRIYMKGDLMDLGARHNAECDARGLKRLHILQHDDSIDYGEN